MAVSREGGGPSEAKTFSTRVAARIVAVSPGRIRYWVRRGLLIASRERGRLKFAFHDLLVMRMAKEALSRRRALGAVRECFERARAMLPGSRPLSALRLSNEDGRIFVLDGGVAVEIESGQMLLDFDGTRASGKLEERFGPARLRERFEEAKRLAETDPLKALKTYGELLGREPANFEAHLKMAALREQSGDLRGALGHLLGAAAMVPTSALVHNRLGAVYRGRGELQRAAESFLRAVECDPLSIEAHRNLAELYEKLGRARDALRHLSAVQRLSRDR